MSMICLGLFSRYGEVRIVPTYSKNSRDLHRATLLNYSCSSLSSYFFINFIFRKLDKLIEKSIMTAAAIARVCATITISTREAS